MEDVCRLRPVTASLWSATDQGGASQSPDVHVTGYCAGRRVLRLWGVHLESQYPDVLVFGENELGAISLNTPELDEPPSSAWDATVLDVTQRISGGGKRAHIYTLFLPREEGGEHVPQTLVDDDDGLEGDCDGHWVCVCVAPSTSLGVKSYTATWYSSDNRRPAELQAAPTFAMRRVAAALASLYGDRFTPPMVNARAEAVATGRLSALQQSSKVDCGVFVMVVEHCICRRADPLVSQVDLDENCFRLYCALCLVAGSVLPSMDGWFEARAQHVPPTGRAPAAVSASGQRHGGSLEGYCGSPLSPLPYNGERGTSQLSRRRRLDVEGAVPPAKEGVVHVFDGPRQGG